MRALAPLLILNQSYGALSFVYPVRQQFSCHTSRNVIQTSPASSKRSSQIRMVAAAPPALGTEETDGTDSEDRANSAAVGGKITEDRRVVSLYDTTLRDGTQMEGISASVNDKLKIAKELHKFGT